MPEDKNKFKRTHYCTYISKDNIGKEISLCGWSQRKRDLGQIIFIDIRDRSGIMQLAFDDLTEKSVFEVAASVRAEDVLYAKGIVRERSSKNPDIPTGDIELEVKEIKILAYSQTPPFEITENSKVNEELRLKYRYLDLRRPDLQGRIMARHRITKVTRDYFDENGFIDIETPVLIKSTPEGARDYLVPSRVFPGKLFALPQSPQLYKQLTMLAGFDRYMQIARCFRDEDLRANRQPEFTQIDFEMSFADEQDIMAVAEGFIKRVYKDVLNMDIHVPFMRMTYEEAMSKYGSDKPDLRFGLQISSFGDILKETKFKVFSDALLGGGTVSGINAKGLADRLTRKETDKLTEFIKAYGVKGLAFTRINKDGSSTSSYEKFLSQDQIDGIRKKAYAESGDVILIIADKNKNIALQALGALRCELAQRYEILDKKSGPVFLWVVDFPLFEYDEEEKRYVAKHHPFTCPRLQDIDKLENEPWNIHARAYDLVLNGDEIGGGSIRINDIELQKKMFRALGFSDDEARKRFGFLMDAFEYGAPPHGGMAFGLDRLVMIMLNCSGIRDVIAFPKVASSAELMTDSPGQVDKKQIDELGIKLVQVQDIVHKNENHPV